MIQFQRPNTFGEAAFYPYKINQSVRYNDDDSPSLYRTPAGAESSRTRWIWSSWMKRCNLPAIDNHIFSVNQGSGWFRAWYRGTNLNELRIQEYNGSSTRWMLVTDGIFRDVTSWHHVLISYDSTDGTTVDRLKIYINGLEADTTWHVGMSPNLESYVGTAYKHAIGSNEAGTGEFDGYIAEPILIMQKSIQNGDYAITDFGKSKYNIWIPKRYTGSYGTNGFKLDFADENDLGNDVSGNNNDFTSSGLTSDDQVLDSPTNNYCVLNTLENSTALILSDGNLKGVRDAQTIHIPQWSTFGVSSGKWYAEFTLTALGGTYPYVGVGFIDDHVYAAGTYIGSGANEYSYLSNGQKANNASLTNYGASYTTGDIIGVVLDLDVGTITFYKNNVSQGQAFTGLSGLFAFAYSQMGSGVMDVNFGQLGFTYTPPTGFKALCSNNIKELQKPSKSYDVYSDCGTEDDYSSGTYAGNGNVDGPVVYLGYYPTDVCIDGDHYDETSSVIDVLSNGFKLRSLTKNTNTTSYTWEAWVYQDGKYSNAAGNVV